MTGRVVHHDFARRANAQTVRDRKAISAWKRMPDGGLVDQVEHERRTAKTSFVGGVVLGFVWGAGLVGFFWMLTFWVEVGGAP